MVAASARTHSRLAKARGVSRRKQGGFIAMGPLFAAVFGSKKKAFTYSDLFKSSEPGVHFETYDPNALYARRNWLLYSEDFTNAGWVKTNATVTTAAALAPDGTLTATRISPVATGACNIGLNAVAAVGAAGATFTHTWKVKAAGKNFCTVYNVSGNDLFYVNLTTGAASGGTTFSNIAISVDGSGWVTITYSSVSNGSAYGYVGPADAAGSTTATLNGTDGIYVWNAQLDKGTVVTAYQKVTDWNTEYLAAVGSGNVYMWQDGNGATPVTAVEQPVGLWMDKSRSGVLSAELLAATADRDFSSDTGFWSKDVGVSIGSGTANWAATAATFQLYRLTFLTAGKVYEVTFDVTSYTAGGVKLGGGLNGLTRSAVGTYTQRMLATTGTFGFASVGASTTLSIDNVSIKEVTGSHATQSAGVSRPVLSARYNGFTKTEQLTDVAWTKSGATVTATADPNGGQTAFKLAEDGTTTTHYAYGVATVVAGVAQKAVFRIKPAERTWAFVYGESSTTGAIAYFNLSGAGTVGTVGGSATGKSATITLRSDGYYECSLTWIATTSGGVNVGSGATTGDNTITHAGTVGSGVYLWRPDIRTSNDWTVSANPTYQRVNTATDYDTAGFIHYLKFDGTDDSLQTPSIDFSTVDKMAVWFGLTKLSDAATGVALELSAIATSNAGAFYIAAPNSPGTFGFFVSGTGSARYDTSGFTAPISRVLRVVTDLSGVGIANELFPYINGALNQTGAVGTDAGSGNFGNYPLNIGRRNNASFPLNGRVTTLTVRGSTTPSSTAFLQKMEQYAAARAGLSFTST